MARARAPHHRSRTLIGAGITSLIVASLATVASPATAAVKTFNPFSINNGFTIVSQGDAFLNNGEVEGAVTAFGTVSTGNQNGYPVIHSAAGLADYTVPLIDGDPVRLLATEFVGAGAFDVSNRDDSGTIAADSPERLATAKFVTIDGLVGSQRGGGNNGGDFLRVTNPAGGILDLKAVPYATGTVNDLKTAETSVAAYFTGLSTHVTQTNACLSTMYSSAELSNTVTVANEGDMAFLTGFSTTMPNVVNYADLANKTIKADRTDGYAPTATAPLVIRVAPGTTTISKVTFEGWSASASAQQNYARYIMLDLSQVTGSVTIDGFELGAIWAPTANITFNSGVTTNGQWFAQDVTTAGGGEVHHQAFLGQLLCNTSDDDDSEADANSTATAEADADSTATAEANSTSEGDADSGTEGAAQSASEGSSDNDADSASEGDADSSVNGIENADATADADADADANANANAASSADAASAADSDAATAADTSATANATATATATANASGTGTSTDGSASLPRTGATVTWPLFALGGVLLMGGMFAMRRRRA